MPAPRQRAASLGAEPDFDPYAEAHSPADVHDDLPPPHAPFMGRMNREGSMSSLDSAASSSINLSGGSTPPNLRHSPSSNSLFRQSAAAAINTNLVNNPAASIPRNSSTHSFRAAPLLSPATRYSEGRSRPSSWMPPAAFTPNDAPSTPLSPAFNGLGQTPSSTALALAYAHGAKGRRAGGRTSTRSVPHCGAPSQPR